MNYLEKALEAEVFSRYEAYAFIHAIAEDQLLPEAIAAVLIASQQRGITLDELQGFRQALLELAIVPELETEDSIDLCGTGGDGKNTFNISTTSALLLAAMGQRVIKHGNYAVSSSCGSSDVLEALGIPLQASASALAKQLDRHGICFLHATFFHPTLKKVAPIRKALGVRTVFNALGPLVNPVQPPYQLSGTFSLELAHLYQHVLSDVRRNFQIVYSMDGYDEISLTGDFRVLGQDNDRLFPTREFIPSPLFADQLRGGKNAQEAATIIRNVLQGEGTEAHNQVVAANSALALHTLLPSTSIQDHYLHALDFLRSGTAIHHLNKML
jgi:anthranilate phosphoribosyltransferase